MSNDGYKTVGDLSRAWKGLPPEPTTVTEREAVLREREAFKQGVVCERARLPFGETAVWVARRDRLYPLPVRRRPIRVELSDGTKWGLRSVRYAGEENSSVFWLYDDGSKSLPPSMVDFRLLRMHAQTPADFEAIAKMLRGETEEVPEGEE